MGKACGPGSPGFWASACGSSGRAEGGLSPGRAGGWTLGETQPLTLSGNQPTVLETAEAFHPGKSRWEALPAMPTPRCACSSLVLRNCLLAVGGVNQGLSDAVEALCVSDS